MFKYQENNVFIYFPRLNDERMMYLFIYSIKHTNQQK